MNKYLPYSVLMSVYYKENPEYLHESIDSMLVQTVPPEQFVLVCDGPLTDGLDAVVNKYGRERPELFTVVRLEENMGIGAAAQAGLVLCRNDLIAKMDSDDIARPYRCEKQLEIFSQKPGLSIVGGNLSEFTGDVSNVVAIRHVPSTHQEIMAFSKKRMPFNNQTVMYKRQAAETAGGYSPLRRCEDYDLYVRMLHTGAVAENLEDILVDFRLNADAYKRRGNWRNFSSIAKVRRSFYRAGYISLADYLISLAGHFALWLCPSFLHNFVYKKMLRS